MNTTVPRTLYETQDTMYDRVVGPDTPQKSLGDPRGQVFGMDCKGLVAWALLRSSPSPLPPLPCTNPLSSPAYSCPVSMPFHTCVSLRIFFPACRMGDWTGAISCLDITYSTLLHAFLWCSLWAGSSECVRLLIDVGANLEAHDCHFGTPLHVACAREHLDCVKVLLNAGANVNAAKLHETALHHAAKVKNVDLIEMLVAFGGNIYARDNRGKKPSDYVWNSSAPAKCLEFYESPWLSFLVAFRRRHAGRVPAPGKGDISGSTLVISQVGGCYAPSFS
ncbi:ankyrin repeat and SOCS box protein 13 isoform X3 [Mirounga leonina]|uniref:ankyrin repeat and SOCS box protein 13 isoform X3 n=1 Tax=Mirounga leonina TaxID=9715 RepID=UPI00156C4CE7|nr:ankyrin repeat and SOCS box protein 13 isoform X3 [Mirounga leonina]